MNIPKPKHFSKTSGFENPSVTTATTHLNNYPGVQMCCTSQRQSLLYPESCLFFSSLLPAQLQRPGFCCSEKWGIFLTLATRENYFVDVTFYTKRNRIIDSVDGYVKGKMIYFLGYYQYILSFYYISFFMFLGGVGDGFRCERPRNLPSLEVSK